jgi:hypothetical protein
LDISTTVSVTVSVAPAETAMVFCLFSWNRMMLSKITSFSMVSVAPDAILNEVFGLFSGVGSL